MKEKQKWIRIIYIIGAVALVAGILDPLEGSVVIMAGSLLLAISTFLSKEKNWKIFLASFLLIVTGVFFMFYFSSLGGFGGGSELSWWWSPLILPYPIGWIMAVVMLIIRERRKKKESVVA